METISRFEPQDWTGFSQKKNLCGLRTEKGYGYVAEYKRDYEKGNPLYIQLTDPFLLFHYHFLSEGNDVTCYDDLMADTGVFMNWRGHAFEILCMHHIPQLKRALGISGVKTRCFPWTNPNQDERVQVDLVVVKNRLLVAANGL